jgi:broad specificity phosphatase PhoE
MMPLRFFLVRHGESDGNFSERDQKLAEEIRMIPNNELRLTKTGVQQARKAGEWLREYLSQNCPDTSKLEGFVSSFVRAKETAGTRVQS